jgi:DNA-binding GntR family transcriptional regulator
MAHFKEHCRECKEKLGEEFPQVHKWLDEFFPRLGFDVRHRDVRHHEDGIEEVRKMWGDEAAEAARLHIANDFDGWVPKNSLEVQDWRFGIIHHPEQ